MLKIKGKRGSESTLHTNDLSDSQLEVLIKHLTAELETRVKVAEGNLDERELR